MKIIDLNVKTGIEVNKKLIKLILDSNINAFKSTKWQFLRNNKAYYAPLNGLIA
jgi:hypothetical protein